MIDLGALSAVEVDPPTRRVRCGAGTSWAQFNAATAPYALAVPGGTIYHTGVGGLTLGGGIGWFGRQAGLSCDNLVGAEVVTADGRIVTASADENPDLFFWAAGDAREPRWCRPTAPYVAHRTRLVQVRAAHGDTKYARLAEVRAGWDPGQRVPSTTRTSARRCASDAARRLAVWRAAIPITVRRA
jgi:hypothetical protein